MVRMMYPDNNVLLACMDLIDEAARALGEDIASVMRRNLARYVNEGRHRSVGPADVTATVMGASSPPSLDDYAKYVNFDAGQRAIGHVPQELNDDGVNP